MNHARNLALREVVGRNGRHRDAGVDVISSEEYLVHTSGHGCKEDIKRMLELVRPRVMIPVHGDKRDIRKQKRYALKRSAVGERPRSLRRCVPSQLC